MGSREDGAGTCERLIGGRYRIDSELGRGASAIVYRAFDTRLHRPVALKRMRADASAPRLEQRFVEEARTLAGLRHSNLLEVYDVGDDEGTPFVASRLLEGETMESAAAGGPISPAKALSWCLPILGALSVAHDYSIVHRDVKPSNIFLEKTSGGREIPILLDFGIARRADRRLEETTSGVTLGTPAYMAPEVISGEAPSPSSDVWSMGVVLYRLLSARHPFGEGASFATLVAVVRDAPTPLLERAPDLPRALTLAVDRALRPRSTRYRDARSFAQALLEAAVASGVAVPSAPDPKGLPDWDRWLASAASSESTARVVASAGDSSRASTARTTLAPVEPIAIAATSANPVLSTRWRALGWFALSTAAIAGGTVWTMMAADSRPAHRPVEAPSEVVAAQRHREPASVPATAQSSERRADPTDDRESSEPVAIETAVPTAISAAPATSAPTRRRDRIRAPAVDEAREESAGDIAPTIPTIVRSWEL